MMHENICLGSCTKNIYLPLTEMKYLQPWVFQGVRWVAFIARYLVCADINLLLASLEKSASCLDSDAMNPNIKTLFD